MADHFQQDRPLPVGACECHSHIYGPFDRFPIAADAKAELAPFELYDEMLTRIGADRSVIVQPSAYRKDGRSVLDAIERRGQSRSVGVLAVDWSITPGALIDLDREGVRGLRFMPTEPGAPAFDDIGMIAKKLADVGWHIQLQGRGELLQEREDLIRTLPCDVVIDHVGRVPLGDGVDHPAFQTLLRLVETGRVWVKLSGFYYGFVDGDVGYAEVGDRVKALIATRPDRLVWGANWPHPGFPADNKPDDIAQRDLLLGWMPRKEDVHRIFVENPTALYRFAS